jgi:hypothetical protein
LYFDTKKLQGFTFTTRIVKGCAVTTKVKTKETTHQNG